MHPSKKNLFSLILKLLLQSFTNYSQEVCYITLHLTFLQQPLKTKSVLFPSTNWTFLRSASICSVIYLEMLELTQSSRLQIITWSFLLFQTSKLIIISCFSESVPYLHSQVTFLPPLHIHSVGWQAGSSAANPSLSLGLPKSALQQQSWIHSRM